MLVQWVTRSFAGLALVASLALMAPAAEKEAAPERETVEMFAAIENGDIEVVFVPKNDKQATVVVKNKTKKPLSVKMPEAFAGVPVLAQFGVGGGNVGGGFNNNQGGANQALGGGFGGGFGGGLGGGGFGGGGLGGGGFFNVEPEKAHKVKVTTVCLEHGKRNPNPSVKYKIVPLETFSTDPQLAEVCKMLGRGEVDQTSAQVAAWHLANDMTFEQLATKVIKHLNGTVELYFHPAHVQQGMKIVQVAKQRVEEAQKSQESLGKSGSLSQK